MTNKLARWIARSGMTRTAVAAELLISPSYLSQLCKPAPPWPSRPLAQAIAKLTNDQVTIVDFVDLKPMPRKRRLAA